MKMGSSARRYQIVSFYLIILITVCTFNSCSSGKTKVIIENKGAKDMKSVIVHVRGNSYILDDIRHNTSKSVKVEVTGESIIKLSQATGDSLILGVYLEPGYGGTVQAVVTPDSVLSVDYTYDFVPF